MSKNNFKVKCLDSLNYNFLTTNKAYKIKDGIFTYDDDDTYECESFEHFIKLQCNDGTKWELINKKNKSKEIKELKAEIEMLKLKLKEEQENYEMIDKIVKSGGHITLHYK